MNLSERTSPIEPHGSVPELVAGAEREAAERVSAVWQRHVDQLRAASEEGRDELQRKFQAQFRELANSLQARIAQERLEIVTVLMQSLGECFARMRRYESDWKWCEALLDAAATISRRTAFFSIRGRSLCFQGARGLPAQNRTAPVEAPLEAAPSFFAVWQRSAPVEVRPDPSHLSKAIANLFGEPGERRALLMPVLTMQQTAGILFTEGAVDRAAVEAVAAFAGATFEMHLRDQDALQGRPAHGTDTALKDALDQPAVLAARRFARVTVARLLIENGEAVRRGRASKNLYDALKSEIDGARCAYEERFPGAADYLHSEVVRTLAQDDPAVLGRQYPGPLS